LIYNTHGLLLNKFHCLKAAAVQFPDIEVVWSEPVLKIYASSTIDWEVFIVYSHAYASPVLYFRSRTQYLTYEETLNHIKAYSDHVSPAELPLTGEPCYFLHPCNTKNILKDLNLAAWIGIVFKTIGISLPIKLFYEYSLLIQEN
jgi:Autophagocytosis associated protein, active-site domain